MTLPDPVHGLMRRTEFTCVAIIAPNQREQPAAVTTASQRARVSAREGKKQWNPSPLDYPGRRSHPGIDIEKDQRMELRVART